MRLGVCKPEQTVEAQLEHCGQEFEELVKAMALYRNDANGKNRADVLFEALDCIACIWTLIYMLFKHNEVLAGIKYVNSKNFVRGYLINPDDYDLYDDDGAVTESEA
jgi:hypothetical protein